MGAKKENVPHILKTYAFDIGSKFLRRMLPARIFTGDFKF